MPCRYEALGLISSTAKTKQNKTLLISPRPEIIGFPAAFLTSSSPTFHLAHSVPTMQATLLFLEHSKQAPPSGPFTGLFSQPTMLFTHVSYCLLSCFTISVQMSPHLKKQRDLPNSIPRSFCIHLSYLIRAAYHHLTYYALFTYLFV